jgi:hypothetical protein
VVDLRWWMAAVGAVALVLVLFRQLYPAELPYETRTALDLLILVLIVGALGIALHLIGLI